jgi:hypothetical protein
MEVKTEHLGLNGELTLRDSSDSRVGVGVVSHPSQNKKTNSSNVASPSLSTPNSTTTSTPTLYSTLNPKSAAALLTNSNPPPTSKSKSLSNPTYYPN